MTIRKLLIATALIATGFAMLRPLFGFGVFLLAIVPLVSVLMFRRPTWNRWVRWGTIAVCLIPLWAVSMGPYIVVQRTLWGHSIPPDWFRSGYTVYKPFGFIWATPGLTQYGYRFEDTWQNVGFLIGRSLSMHDQGSDLPVFAPKGGEPSDATEAAG